MVWLLLALRKFKFKEKILKKMFFKYKINSLFYQFHDIGYDYSFYFGTVHMIGGLASSVLQLNRSIHNTAAYLLFTQTISTFLMASSNWISQQ